MNEAPNVGERNEIAVRYFIEREEVSENVFMALFEQLELDDSSTTGETIVREDGSYGGASEETRASFDGRHYRYVMSTFPDEGEIRSIESTD